MPTEHALKWSQSDPLAVASWEFQYSPNGIVWRWVQHVHPVDDCVDCFQAIVTMPEQMMMVRMRAVSISGISSEWSDVQHLPEPSVDVALWWAVIGLLALALFTRRRT